MIYNILIIILIIAVSILIAKKDKNDNKKYKIAIGILFIIGFSVRLISIGEFPNGLNVDEVSSGYEAYSIGNYGIDRNGNFLPIFLKSWGSGQNALYTYILIPFIKIFGLNIITTRLPMALIGCVSLFIMYKILQKTGSNKLALIGLIFFTICPWHIMKSRWGLESNILPDIILLAVYLIILFLENKKIKYLYLSSAILRNICIFIWNSIFLFTNIFINIINCTHKEKINKYKTKHNIFRNNRSSYASYDNLLNNKLF